MAPPLWQLAATDLQRLYRERSVTPLEVAQACLQRLDAVNPRINAVIARRDEALLREARASTARHAVGTPLSPLDGIPLTVKDSLFTKDQVTTWGCPALAQHRPEHDELSVGRARAAGALVLGKTNVPEFALEGYTDNPIFGTTRNPWDLALTPGGSTGGGVAAVASGIGPLAIGQDGGGSIRRPASHTGLVGLKPSLSAVPRHHATPSLLLDFEVIGPIGRTVADVQLLFSVMRGPDPIDRSSLSAAQAAGTPLPKRLRILYVKHWGDAPLDPQIARSCDEAVQRLAALGDHPVEVGQLPLSLEFYGTAWPQIGQVGLARLFERHPDWAAQASNKYLAMAEQGRALPAARLWEIVEDVRQLRRDTVDLFRRWDLIVLPSAAALPWKAEDAYPARIDGREVGPRGHAVYTGWVNAAGLPGLALPCEPTEEGLPIGMQLVGPYGSDEALLELGARYEQAHSWAHRWPSL
ncbi:MAG TPA: amidase [Ramlibacter sp.]|nr:amidase [Ramlibacter sp.]